MYTLTRQVSATVVPGVLSVWDELAVKALEILACIGALLVLVLLNEASKYLREQARRVENSLARELLMSAITEAELVGADAVYSTNQVFADALRRTSADGKLSKEDAANAMQIAVDYFKTHISSTSSRILGGPAELADKWIREFLEAKLAQIKANRGVGPGALPLLDVRTNIPCERGGVAL